MGIRTVADERIDSAKGCICDAIENLKEIVINKCHGFEDYGDNYRQTLHEVFAKLIEIENEL